MKRNLDMKKILAALALSSLAVACGQSSQGGSAQSAVTTPEFICAAKSATHTYQIFNLPAAKVNTLRVDIYSKASGKKVATHDLPESNSTAGSFSIVRAGSRILAIDEHGTEMFVTDQLGRNDYSSATCK
jgi:predicted ABC-type sugar transport system permease subunit